MEGYPLYDYRAMAVNPASQPGPSAPSPTYPLYSIEKSKTNTFRPPSSKQPPPPYQQDYAQPPYQSRMPPAYGPSGSTQYNVPTAWPPGAYSDTTREAGWGAGYNRPPVAQYPYPGLYNQPQMQQQQTTTVVIGGQARPAIYQPVPFVESFSGHLVLACFTAWCCNPLFGLIAFILAAIASNHAYSDPPGARRLGRASIVLSIIGIIFTIVLIIVICVVAVTWQPRSPTTGTGTGSSSGGGTSYGTAPYTCYMYSGVATACSNCAYSESCYSCYSYAGYTVPCDGRR